MWSGASPGASKLRLEPWRTHLPGQCTPGLPEGGRSRAGLVLGLLSIYSWRLGTVVAGDNAATKLLAKMNASLRHNLGWTLIGKSNLICSERLAPSKSCKMWCSYIPQWFLFFKEVESVQNGSHTHYTSRSSGCPATWGMPSLMGVLLRGTMRQLCGGESGHVWQQAEGASGSGHPLQLRHI